MHDISYRYYYKHWYRACPSLPSHKKMSVDAYMAAERIRDDFYSAADVV